MKEILNYFIRISIELFEIIENESKLQMFGYNTLIFVMNLLLDDKSVHNKSLYWSRLELEFVPLLKDNKLVNIHKILLQCLNYYFHKFDSKSHSKYIRTSLRVLPHLLHFINIAHQHSLLRPSLATPSPPLSSQSPAFTSTPSLPVPLSSSGLSLSSFPSFPSFPFYPLPYFLFSFASISTSFSSFSFLTFFLFFPFFPFYRSPFLSSLFHLHFFNHWYLILFLSFSSSFRSLPFLVPISYCSLQLYQSPCFLLLPLFIYPFLNKIKRGSSYNTKKGTDPIHGCIGKQRERIFTRTANIIQ